MKIEIRSDGTAVLDGYVNVVGRESRVLQDVAGDEFVEIIAPKTFQRALERNDNVGLMFNHERDIAPISMRLREDNIGLRATVEINDLEVLEKAKENKLTGWSFGFYAAGETWDTRSDGMKLRTVTAMDLVEVSILDCTPAYIATSIEMRNDKERLREVRNCLDDVEVVAPQEENRGLGGLALLRQQKRMFDFMVNVK